MRISKRIELNGLDVAEAVAFWLTAKGQPCNVGQVETRPGSGIVANVEITEPEPQAAAPEPTFPKRSEVYFYSMGTRWSIRARASDVGAKYFCFHADIFFSGTDAYRCREDQLQDG